MGEFDEVAFGHEFKRWFQSEGMELLSRYDIAEWFARFQHDRDKAALAAASGAELARIQEIEQKNAYLQQNYAKARSMQRILEEKLSTAQSMLSGKTFDAELIVERAKCEKYRAALALIASHGYIGIAPADGKVTIAKEALK